MQAGKLAKLSLVIAALMVCGWVKAAGVLQDKTLRVDYVFSGTDRTCTIAVNSLCSFDGWYGRNVNMDRTPLRGNGRIRMADAATGGVLYAHSFSTLFQEWQATEEATRLTKSFENVFLLPMPSSPVDITVELYNLRGEVLQSYTHRVDPSDILISQIGKYRQDTFTIQHSGPSSACIDVAIVAEGYTSEEAEIFREDAAKAWQSVLEHEPFKSMSSRFNVIAVPLASRDSEVSVPGKGVWKDTALKSHFNTFYMDRYLTTLHLCDLHDALAGLPYEHIIILANTDNYGGGGIYNSYTLTTSRGRSFEQVVVHEFGHSFAGLADEYYYDDMFSPYYFPETEPWEQNITTMKDFDSKWKDMMGQDGVSLHEGAGYQSKGAWRACEDCRMKTNKAESFCPVCQRAIRRMIDFYTLPQ